MALTPHPADPNYEKEKQRIEKALRKGPQGAEELKRERNIDVGGSGKPDKKADK